MDTISAALETLKGLGVDPLLVIAVVFITTLFKSFDTKNKFKQGYVFFPLCASLLVCFTIKPFSYEKWIIASCIHAGLGSYLYNVYANTLKKKG